MYKDVCPRCAREINDINNFYCIKNRGGCEHCIIFSHINKYRKLKMRKKFRETEKEFDPFWKYRIKNYTRQTVDKQ